MADYTDPPFSSARHLSPYKVAGTDKISVVFAYKCAPIEGARQGMAGYKDAVRV